MGRLWQHFYWSRARLRGVGRQPPQPRPNGRRNRGKVDFSSSQIAVLNHAVLRVDDRVGNFWSSDCRDFPEVPRVRAGRLDFATACDSGWLYFSQESGSLDRGRDRFVSGGLRFGLYRGLLPAHSAAGFQPDCGMDDHPVDLLCDRVSDAGLGFVAAQRLYQ